MSALPDRRRHVRREVDILNLSDTDRLSLQARLERNSEKRGQCLIWTGRVTDRGYGHIRVGSRRHNAHRVAYAVWRSDEQIAGLDIDHLCRVRSCINPDHLEAVTHRTNVLRSSGPAAVNAVKEACVQGHLFAIDGYVNKRGVRTCRVCKQAKNRAYRAMRRVA